MTFECVASAIANCVGNLATEYASPYVGYFFHFGKNVEKFKDQREALQSKKDRVESDVAVAERQTEVIENDVKDWLTRAEKELGEAQSLEDEIERSKCSNWCPNWGWRCCLSKKVAKKELSISELLETCNFPRVGQRAPLQGIEFLLPKDFMRSESSTLVFNGIMKALKSDGVNMIGLYGMPGVGKTTLADAVLKQATEQKLFDKAVIVTVSQTPDFDKIQERIAELFGLKFVANTKEGKAEELWRRLKGEKKILIILDDVWKELELQTIGIPFGGENEGCKILLTTRLQQVCSQMNRQEKFELKILSENEAWALFKDKAGLKDDSPTLNVAKEVAHECGCLPLAIVTVAKALKGESLDEWIAANKRLKSSRHLDNQHVCGGIYTCLELSYDYLDQDNIKQCFLLCALFPEDYEIGIELLTVIGLGLGLFGDINLIEELRREIGLALSRLQKSGLLLQTDDEESVKMHDVVRDFAHWITSTGEKMFMVKNELTEWPNSENFDCYTAISLWNSKIDNFPERLEFSKLKTLILSGRDYQIVPSTFFEGMKALQILFLERHVFSMEAFQFLKNLRILSFVRCGLQEDISSLRNLKNLEFLELSSVDFEELPEELLELHRLKSLYFSCFGDGPINVPPNLLSRLTSLQELHVPRDNNANLLELNSLSRLITLTLIVSTDQCFQENFVFPKLQSYSIAVNAYIEFPEKRISRILTISDCSSLNAFKELFPNVQKLTLFKVMEHKTVVPNVDQWGLNELTSLQLTSCDDLECLIDTTWEQSPTTAFSNLVNLDIGKMTSLKELCNGQSPNSFLQNLETLIICDCGQLQSVFQMNGQMLSISNLRSLELQSLPALESIWKEPTHRVNLQSLKDVKVDGCDKLKSIFSTYLAQSLLHLEQLKISACKKLEQVFAFAQDMAELEENQAPPLSNLICLELESLPELSCIWREPTHLVKLKSLKTMRIGSCSKLEYLFSPTLAQALVHLEELEIKESNSLKHLIMEAENGDEIVSNKDRSLLCWPKLKSFEIASCKSLRYVFPITLAQGLPHLESVQIIDCPQLMHVFNMAKEEDGHDILLPRLQFLRLEYLQNLRSFCPRNYFVMLPSLKEFQACNIGLPPESMAHFHIHQSLCSWSLLRDVQLQALKELLHNVKNLTLNRVMYQKSLVPNVDPKGLNDLNFLALKGGKELECLIDTTLGHVSTNAFFNLVELVIEEMTGLKMLCNGQFPKGFLQKLEKLTTRNCMEMVSLSPALQNLKEVKVINCGQLQEVFQIDEFLHDTKENQGLLLSNLTLMELNSLPALENIWKEPTHLVSLQSLKDVKVDGCDKLKSIFSPCLTQSLLHLEQLKISACKKLEQVFAFAQDMAEFAAPPLSNLFCLELESLPELRCIWREPTHLVNLQNLKTMRICSCSKLEYLFSPTLAQALVHLEELKIKESNCLEHLIIKAENGDEIVSNKDRSLLCWPKLKSLEIVRCKSLRYVFPITLAHGLPYLESVQIIDCPQLMHVFNMAKEEDKHDIMLPKLQFLRLEDLENLRSFCDDQWGLNELTSLEVAYCDDLECLIDTTREQSPTTAFSNLVNLDIGKMTSLKELCHGESPNSFLQNLETLIICDCGQLQSVFQMNGQMLSILNLRSLELQSLPALESIWKEPTHYVSLQSLKDVKVDGCDKLKSIFSTYLVQSLLHLEQLKISACKKLEQVFASAQDMAELEENQAPPLSNLICLELESLPELKCIWREPTRLVNLQSLKTMRIGLCSKLEYLFSPTLAQALVHLEELKVMESNSLKHLIMEAENGDEIVSNKERSLLCWPKLKSLEIASCKSLRYVFPITLAQGLPYLESVQIIDCPQLMHVFNMAKEEDGHDILLPRLQFLRLEYLQNLRSFCPRNYFVMLPSLKEFQACNIGLPPESMAHFHIHQSLCSWSLLRDVQLQALKELLHNVKNLTLNRVMYQKSLVPNVDPKGLNDLNFLALKGGKELECLIDTTLGHVSTNAFFNLVELVIEEMTGLKMLCNGQFPKGFLQKLEKLTTRNCMEMVSLSPALQNLKEVKVINCGQLQEVFQIDEFLHDTKENQGLLLSNLTLMELNSLPALENIWKEPTHLVSLQSLKDVKVDGCDKLKSIFSPCLTQSLLHLEQLKISACKKLEQVFAFAQDMAEFAAPPLSNLFCLELESLPELRCIWREPTHLVNLQNLKTMRICSCSKLEYLFSPTLAQALVHLEELKIKESNCLEHLIIEAEIGDQIVSNKDRSLLCWPKLKSLEIASCKSLRYAFPITLAQGLPYLESVQIIDCPQLMHVFNMAKEEDKHDIMLPKLQFLRLEDLENLRSFCPRNCFVKLPSFKGLEASNVGPRPQVMSHSQNQQGLTWQYQLKDIEINAVKELLYNVKSLALTRVMYHKNLVPNVDPKGLNELTFLALKDGKELECLIDTTEGHVSTSAFFNLLELVIQDMTSMKMLCNGQFPKGFLQKLEKLEATNCMEMVSLSPTLQDLKEVKVINCGQLQEVFQIDELLHDAEEPLLSNLALMELHLLPELKWIWKGSTHFVRLQSLKYLAISFCNSLKYLFSPSLAQSLVLLEHLNIYHCYGLQHIINELDCDDGIEPNAHLHSPFLPKLETLTISNCPKLEYVFQISLAQVPPRLKFVSISDSPQLQQVFNVAKEKHGVDRAIALPCLQQLQLGNLINLSCFFSENFLITSPSLENLVFWDCPKLTNFTIQKEVNEQAQLKDLGLHAMKDLLYNAKSLTLKGVMYQKNLVPSVDPKGLNELTFLLIKDGKELECLIDTTEGHVSTNAFFNLVQLVIQEMTGFKMLCNGRIPKGFLQKLEKLEATNCMEMVSLSPMLQNLKEVKVINCGQLQEVFQTDEILHDTKENQGPLLSNLALMELHSLPELKLIWKGSTHFVSLQSLMFVEISYCNRLKYLFSPFLAQSLVLLEQLKIDHCNGLQHIITELEFDDEIESEDHPYSPLLPKLETLTISDCPKLEYVFQTPLAQVLPRLKFVWINNSPQLQQLFNVTKEENGVGRAIVLPCLQDLRLGNLINLSCFCSKNFLIAAPSLEKLVVFNCLKLSNFTIQKEVNQQAQLKELYLSDLGNDKGCNTINSQSRWSLVNLEYITVGNCVKIFQMQAGQFFSRVENIQLEHLHQLQGPIQVASLQCLRWLHVSKCNRLKYLLSPMLVRNLPHLTHLEINHCEELEQIIEMDQTSASSSQAHLQPISFPSLEIIRIYKCSNLKSLFPLSITCSPSKVKIISIDGASKLERVFNLDVEDDQKGIVLPNLQGLLLKELPSLKSLSQGYHFRFPCMHYAEVKECPKLSTSFSIDSKRVVHAITEAPEQVENDRREGLITKEEIVDNQAACNDVFWLCGYQEETLPLYMNVDEAEDN